MEPEVVQSIIQSVPLNEALRYAGVPRPSEEDYRSMRATADRLRHVLQPRRVWKVFPVEKVPEGMSLVGSGLVLPGEMASTMLADCPSAVLIACTAGTALDGAIRTWQARDLAMAVLMDGYGSAFVEAVADQVEREIAARFPDLYQTDRFSPGYGDLPLDLQPGILTALNAYRLAGIAATDSLMLQPCKSITAVLGLSPRPQRARIRGCGHCALRETCRIRKGGNSCAL